MKKNLSVHVRFRFLLASEATRREAKYRKLLQVYSKKLSELISKVMTTPLTAVDYENLPEIRKHLREHGSLDDILGSVGPLLPAEAVKLLVDVTPLFQIAPVDFKAFTLLALGVRAHNLKPTVTPIEGAAA